MPKQQLNKNKSDRIGKDTMFAIMGKLSVRQRAILSLKYFEGMSPRQVSYVLDMGYFRVLWHVLSIRTRLKLLLMINGYHAVTFKTLIAAFGQMTSI